MSETNRLIEIFYRTVGHIGLYLCRHVEPDFAWPSLRNGQIGVTRDESRPPCAPARILASHLALTPGTRLGVYEIIASIGDGGMGEVYRATDTTLGRQVAIKILPDAFASDPERLARFEREAKTLASLNHPHIAAIYGFEKSAGMHALVMELVEGPTLADRDRARRDSPRRSLAHREADRRGARSRARAGDHSSRSQAREHQGAARRHREGARLRPRESDGTDGRDRRRMSRNRRPSRRRR